MSVQRDHQSASSATGDAPVLLTGASGYVGRHLLQALETAGRRVRCAVRRPKAIAASVPGTEVVRADLLHREDIVNAMRGVGVAYYLVHSMNSARPFEQADREAARNFAQAARDAGVQRIVYLGGLGNPDAALSPHLRSRHEVGEVLRSTGVQVIEFRASAVIGAGSLSFEMIRALTERLPIMVTPRWITIAAQPIGIDDVIQYLLAALELDTAGNQVFEIGGADRVSYGAIIEEYARQRGLRRLMIRVPVLTPRLSSWWLRLVTPLQARVGRELIEGVRDETVVTDDLALRTFAIRPAGIRQAISDSLRSEDAQFAHARWADTAAAMRPAQWGGCRIGNRLVVSQSICVDPPPAIAFAPIRRIGGRTGWYYGDWLWELRGWADRLLGGAGMRRRRRDDVYLALGDRVDCWHVIAFEPDRKLTLEAEMKMPGRAWLDFEVRANGRGSTITQTAIFDPAGAFGLLYWYLSFPIHQLMFAGMLRGIAGALSPNPAPGSPTANMRKESGRSGNEPHGLAAEKIRTI